MYQPRKEERPPEPPPPVGTMRATRTPSDVRLGDFILIDGSYQRVRDMRAAGTAAHRVLHFAGHAPLIMRTSRVVCRPIAFR